MYLSRIVTSLLCLCLMGSVASFAQHQQKAKPATQPALDLPHKTPSKTNSKTKKRSPPIPKSFGPEINEEQAVKIAEKFIVDNGYTDLPAIKDKSKLTPELLDKLMTHVYRMKLRHNSLEKRAYGISKGRRDQIPGWTVVFRRTPNEQFDAQMGRSVVMYPDGTQPHLEFNEYTLTLVDKKLPLAPDQEKDQEKDQPPAGSKTLDKTNSEQK